MSENNFIVAEGIFSKGFGMIGKVVMTDRRITPTSKCIYAYICSFAGNGFSAFPSVEKICTDLRIKSKNTYRKHLNILKQYDYIRIKQQKSNGKFKSNVYTIVLEPNPTVTQNLGDENLPYGKKCVTKKCTTNNNSKDNKNKSTYNKNSTAQFQKSPKEHEIFDRRKYEPGELENYYQDVSE
jgi:hypothetical protein